MTPNKKFESIDEYIESFPKSVQNILEKLRVTIREAAPQAVELIRYGMPTFKLNGKRLVYFSAWKNHIGFYSIPKGDEAFRKNYRHIVVKKAHYVSGWTSQSRMI